MPDHNLILPGEPVPDSPEEHPRWMLLTPKLHETALEIDQDIRGIRFYLLSSLRPYRSEGPELLDNLLAVLWHEETMPTCWLRHVYGASMNLVQEIAEESELNRVYRCLDCEASLETRGRDLALRRRRSLNTILASDGGDIVPTADLFKLLCHVCAEVYLYSRLIRLEELQALPYEDYLRSPEWQKIREAKLKRDGRYCHACGELDLLEMHHIRYAGQRLGDEDLNLLYVFCRVCHKRHHGIRRDDAA